MRLIDADALKKDLKSVTLSNGTLVNTNAVLYLLEEYPTSYDVDKVVEQLRKLKKAEQDRPDDCDEDGCGDGAGQIRTGNHQWRRLSDSGHRTADVGATGTIWMSGIPGRLHH